MDSYNLSYLKQLEAESIHIIRETVAEAKYPVTLYSVGKDSSVMIRLAQKAFYPGKFPFPLMHVDTGYKFPEMYEFRDWFCQKIGATLIIERNEAWIAKGAHPLKMGTDTCCAHLKTQGLLMALKKHGFDAAFGGARREEKSRAKERVCSIRDELANGIRKTSARKLRELYNLRLNEGQSVRVFPLSNWTEVDIWNYIKVEQIPVVPLYFAKERQVVERGNMLIPASALLVAQNDPKSQIDEKDFKTVTCRFRSLGCMPCTGAIRSTATTLDDIIIELQATKKSERENRLIDLGSDSAMEQKKKEGYF